MKRARIWGSLTTKEENQIIIATSGVLGPHPAALSEVFDGLLLLTLRPLQQLLPQSVFHHQQFSSTHQDQRVQ